MKKLVTMLALMMLLTMTAAACSSSDDTGKDSASNPVTTDTATDMEDAADSETSSELAPLKIGNLQDLSGSASEAGRANAWGVEYAVRQINENGGINGRMIELTTLDIKNDVQEGINAYRLLVDENKVDAIIGPPLSNPALAWVDLSAEDKIPVVGHFMDERVTTNEETGEVSPFMFLAEPGCSQQSYCIAKYGINDLKLKTYATFYNAGLSYAVQHALPFAEYIRTNGGEVLAEETFQTGDVDYRAQAIKIAEANPEAVFICNYAADNALCYDYLREAGYEGIILGNNTFQSPFSSLVKSEVYDTYFLQNVDMENPESDSYDIVKAYMDETGAEYPIANACFGYDATMVLADALKRAKDPSDGEEVAALLEQTKDVKSSSGPITINPETHRTIGMPMLVAQYDENFKLIIVDSIALDEGLE
jgi:branched-chain amino acid transport system substrate-binding protein